MTTAPVEEVDYSGEMREAVREFGTYVNHTRALPNVLDGMKPVHRRIVWGMWEMRALPGRTRVKSARAVGDVTGKFHPHGGDACYGTMVTMAQPFSYLLPLIDGHGNWGAPGYGAAAMRYTECRLSEASVAMIGSAPGVIDGSPEVEEEAVDFVPNYSGEFKEPVVLPALWPNFVVNGYDGIGYGIAGQAPCHNLREVMELAIRIVDNPNPRVSTVLDILPGPDMPCDADIYDGRGGIEQYITEGYGTFYMRARYEIEEYKITSRRSGHRIIITGLPYKVSEDAVVWGVQNLIENMHLPQDVTVSNVGTKQTRIVIDAVENDVDDIIQRLLYHSRTTSLQTSFSVSMYAVHEGEIKIFSVVSALRVWVDHRRHVIRRRTHFRLAKAEDRLEIVQGYIKAVPIANEIVDLVRASANRQEAATEMMNRWGFSERQAFAILDMTIGQITKLGVERYKEEEASLQQIIEECKEILANPDVLDKLMKKEMRAIRDAFGQDRRNQVFRDESAAIARPQTPAVEVPAKNGYIVRTGRNWVRWATKSSVSRIVGNDHVVEFQRVTDQDYIEGISNYGYHYRKYVWELPDQMVKAEGIFSLDPGENIVLIGSSQNTRFTAQPDIVMVSKTGLMKRISAGAFEWTIPQSGGTGKYKQVFPLGEGDEVQFAFFLEPGADIGIVTAYGRMLRIDADTILAKGRGAGGNPGVRFSGDNDKIAWAGPVHPDTTYLYWTDVSTVGWFHSSGIEYSSRNTKGVAITRSNNLIEGFIPMKGDTLFWFDGTEDDPFALELAGQTSGTNLSDRQLKLVAKGIKKANAVWSSVDE